MTINEYLSLSYKLHNHADKCEQKYIAAFTRATSPGSPSNMDGTPTAKGTGRNASEDRQIKNADAARKYQDAVKTYLDYKDLLYADLDNVLHWEAMLIEQIYIINPSLDRDDPYYGADRILNTNSTHKIQCKLDEAKMHLAEVMRARGADIDN